MGTAQITLVVSLLAALAMAGLGYAILGRRIEAHDRTSKRMSSVTRSGTGRAARKASVIDAAAQRRRSVHETIKELDAKQKKTRRRISLKAKLEGAGLSVKPTMFYLMAFGLGLGVAGVMAVSGQSLIISLSAGFAAAFGIPHWVLGFLIRRRQATFVSGFADALDIIVRGVKSGLPVNECLKIIANESPAPVGPEFADIIDAQRMGIPVEQALQRLYERMPVAEVNFFMIVLAMQAKTGGNLSEALGNLSRVLRERKKLRAKIAAMSSEAKASAAIIGSLPFIVASLMFMTSPDYISILFEEKMGHMLLACGAFWMTCGILVMRKMINMRV